MPESYCTACQKFVYHELEFRCPECDHIIPRPIEIADLIEDPESPNPDPNSSRPTYVASKRKTIVPVATGVAIANFLMMVAHANLVLDQAKNENSNWVGIVIFAVLLVIISTVASFVYYIAEATAPHAADRGWLSSFEEMGIILLFAPINIFFFWVSVWFATALVEQPQAAGMMGLLIATITTVLLIRRFRRICRADES